MEAVSRQLAQRFDVAGGDRRPRAGLRLGDFVEIVQVEMLHPVISPFSRFGFRVREKLRLVGQEAKGGENDPGIWSNFVALQHNYAPRLSDARSIGTLSTSHCNDLAISP
jgi:hypothetical protein